MFGFFEVLGANKDAIETLVSVVGLLGLSIAWVSYKHNLREMEEARMNGLFRDFLRMEFDFDSTDFGQRVDDRRRAYTRLSAYKMWVLEELFAWNHRRRSQWVFGTYAFRHHWRSITGWDATLIYHINARYESDVSVEFGVSRECYSREFVNFVERWKGKTVSEYTSLMECEPCKVELELERAQWFLRK